MNDKFQEMQEMVKRNEELIKEKFEYFDTLLVKIKESIENIEKTISNI